MLQLYCMLFSLGRQLTQPRRCRPENPKPTDNSHFHPIISESRVAEPHVYKPGGVLECWGTPYLQIDPAYDGYYFDEDLLGWACAIADQEGIMLCALSWPASLCDPLLRSGFQRPVTRAYELMCLDGITRSLGVVGMHRPPDQDMMGRVESGYGYRADKEQVQDEFFKAWFVEDWVLRYRPPSQTPSEDPAPEAEADVA